jgi:hypothetical protein
MNKDFPYFSEEQIAILRSHKFSRFIPFDKFIDFMTKGLFIPNATLFEDNSEGYVLLKEGFLKIKKNELQKTGIFNCFPEYDGDVTSKSELIEHYKSQTFVSCWYNETHESIAMWKYYGANPNSVMITTDGYELSKAYFENKQFIDHSFIAKMGLVKYIPRGEWDLKYAEVPLFHNRETLGTKIDDPKVFLFESFFFKQHPYSFEKEIRLVIRKHEIENEPYSSGIRLEIKDYNSFIKSIKLSPEASLWFRDTVQWTLNQFNIDTKIESSIVNIFI